MEDIDFRPIPTFCFLMRLDDFLEAVERGSFIDDDGHGYLATETQESSVRIEPSSIQEQLEANPAYHGWVTHVAWYNK